MQKLQILVMDKTKFKSQGFIVLRFNWFNWELKIYKPK